MTLGGPTFLDWRTERRRVHLNVRVPDGYRIVYRLPDEWLRYPEWVINGTVRTAGERLCPGG